MVTDAGVASALGGNRASSDTAHTAIRTRRTAEIQAPVVIGTRSPRWRWPRGPRCGPDRCAPRAPDGLRHRREVAARARPLDRWLTRPAARPWTAGRRSGSRVGGRRGQPLPTGGAWLVRPA